MDALAKARAQKSAKHSKPESSKAPPPSPPPPPVLPAGAESNPCKRRRTGTQVKQRADIDSMGGAPGIPDTGVPSDVRCYSLKSMCVTTSPDPRAQLHHTLQQLSKSIREHPTVPCDRQDFEQPCRDAFDDNVAVILPRKHCAFRGCDWRGSCDDELLEHLRENHKAELQPAIHLLPRNFGWWERLEAIYNEAIAEQIRCGAPLASYSIDRRCLRNLFAATADHSIEAPICCLCACSYLHLDTEESKIKGHRPLAYGSLLYRITQ